LGEWGEESRVYCCHEIPNNTTRPDTNVVVVVVSLRSCVAIERKNRGRKERALFCTSRSRLRFRKRGTSRAGDGAWISGSLNGSVFVGAWYG